jgi:hypothetical protein
MSACCGLEVLDVFKEMTDLQISVIVASCKVHVAECKKGEFVLIIHLFEFEVCSFRNACTFAQVFMNLREYNIDWRFVSARY